MMRILKIEWEYSSELGWSFYVLFERRVVIRVEIVLKKWLDLRFVVFLHRVGHGII